MAVIGGGPSGSKRLSRRRARRRSRHPDRRPAGAGRASALSAKAAGIRRLISQLRSLANIEVLQRPYCFGLYEGDLLGILQPAPHRRRARAADSSARAAAWWWPRGLRNAPAVPEQRSCPA